ncbi:MAG: 23S rRNA (guanosine2251-2'-O)-methyltransferase [Rickettsiales bacterium]|jgi:23S rRNA (guanosine2251-2'-O)-methyltransferase
MKQKNKSPNTFKEAHSFKSSSASKSSNSFKNKSSFKSSSAPKNPDSLLNNQVFVYGKHPVFSALLNDKRKIYQLLIAKNNEADLNIFLKEKKVNLKSELIKIVEKDYFYDLFPSGATHQGFALKTSPIELISSNQFLDQTKKIDKENRPPILILDNLTDPQNIGAIIRSSAAFGFLNVAVLSRNFPIQSPIIAKASSGVLEVVNLIDVANLNNFLGELKKLDYWSIGLAGEAKLNIAKAKDYFPKALVVGSEGDGIRKLVKENCDLLVKIPMNGEVESLNASNAAAIAMYELNSTFTAK